MSGTTFSAGIEKPPRWQTWSKSSVAALITMFAGSFPSTTTVVPVGTMQTASTSTTCVPNGTVEHVAAEEVRERRPHAIDRDVHGLEGRATGRAHGADDDAGVRGTRRRGRGEQRREDRECEGRDQGSAARPSKPGESGGFDGLVHGATVRQRPRPTIEQPMLNFRSEVSGPVRSTAMAASGPEGVTSPAVPLQWPLVDRHEEIELFEATLVDPRAHGFVIHGPAGVGKTRLADQCLAVADGAGRNVARATASGGLSAVPLGAWPTCCRPISVTGVDLVTVVAEVRSVLLDQAGAGRRPVRR